MGGRADNQFFRHENSLENGPARPEPLIAPALPETGCLVIAWKSRAIGENGARSGLAGIDPSQSGANAESVPTDPDTPRVAACGS